MRFEWYIENNQLFVTLVNFSNKQSVKINLHYEDLGNLLYILTEAEKQLKDEIIKNKSMDK